MLILIICFPTHPVNFHVCSYVSALFSPDFISLSLSGSTTLSRSSSQQNPRWRSLCGPHTDLPTYRRRWSCTGRRWARR